jgi:hypothetical protein
MALGSGHNTDASERPKPAVQHLIVMLQRAQQSRHSLQLHYHAGMVGRFADEAGIRLILSHH